MQMKNIKNKRDMAITELKKYIIENFDNLNGIFNFNKTLKQVNMISNSNFNNWIISISNKVMFCEECDERFKELISEFLCYQKDVHLEECFEEEIQLLTM